MNVWGRKSIEKEDLEPSTLPHFARGRVSGSGGGKRASGGLLGLCGGESGGNRSHQNRHHDRGQEQQDAAAHRLQDEVHPARWPYLHWYL